MDKLSTLEKKVSELSDKLISLNSKFELFNNIVTDILTRVDKNECAIINLKDRTINNEKYIRNQDIYLRRNNVEFVNIPESIKQRDLENYIVKLLNKIKIKVQSYDIVAVHRLGKYVSGKTRNVIVRFVNRKNSYKCFGIGKKLKLLNEYKDERIFTIENLCPTNKNIFNALYKLKKQELIHSVWSRNGRIFYQENDDYNDFIEANSLDDVDYLFEDPNEESKVGNNRNDHSSRNSSESS